jgi:hypothetical protein
MYRLPLIFIIPFFFFISCENNTLNNTITANSHDKDSISSFIENSKNTSLSIFERKKSLEKSLQILKSKTKDSFYTINLSTIAYQTLKLSDSLLFKKRNKT